MLQRIHPNAYQKYDKWVFETFLKDKRRAEADIVEKSPSATRIGDGQTRVEHAVLVVCLGKVGIGTVAIRVRDRDSLLRAADRCVVGRNQQTILRYLLHNRNEKIANLKSRHDKLKLSSIDSFHGENISRCQYLHNGSIGSRCRSTRDEKPRHKVTLTKDFLMGKYPVTQE